MELSLYINLSVAQPAFITTHCIHASKYHRLGFLCMNKNSILERVIPKLFSSYKLFLSYIYQFSVKIMHGFHEFSFEIILSNMKWFEGLVGGRSHRWFARLALGRRSQRGRRNRRKSKRRKSKRRRLSVRIGQRRWTSGRMGGRMSGRMGGRSGRNRIMRRWGSNIF